MPAPPAVDPEDDEDGVSRRTLVRLLVGTAIGVPVLVEALTFLGLVGNQFGSETPTATDTTTPDESGVGVGDELLVETAQTETVREAYVAEDDWTFTLVVTVENASDRTYDLRLGAVTTGNGQQVDGGSESGPIAPGESGAVTGRWQLPDGSFPETVDVAATARDGTVTTVERSVELAVVPVRG